MSEHYDEFKSFIQTRAQGDDTWKFWVQFVFQDPMAYVDLFLKFMAPVFTAFDHHIYQNLISAHVADILTMPNAVVAMFQWNIQVQIETATKKNLLPITGSNRGLINPFTNKQTSASQHHFC